VRRSQYALAATVLAVVTALAVAGLIAPLSVDASSGSVAAVWKDYVIAEKRLQFDVSRLVAQQWPELAGVANLQRDQKFAALELRNMEFHYLLEHEPSRIVIDGGLSAFTEFDWTEEDTDSLRAAKPVFTKLEKWVDLNAERLAEHPNLALARERLFSLQRDEYYVSMVERFQTRLDDLERALDRLAGQKRRPK